MRPYRDTSADPAREKTPRDLVYVAPGDATGPLLAAFAATWGHLAALASGRPFAPRGNERRVVLAVDDGRLSVTFGARCALTVPIDRLVNVELDTRAESRSQTGVRPDGTMSVGASFGVDVSRLVLVFAEREERLPLSETFGSYGAQLEAMAKVRAFLRGHGWLPEDERSVAVVAVGDDL